MSGISGKQNEPRSIRQKRILSIAAENPEASLEQIASKVATATPDVVEKVLKKFGDPAEQDPTMGQPNTEIATSDGGKPKSKGGSQLTDEVAKIQKVPVETAEDQQAEPNETTNTTPSASLPTPEALTPKQRETFEAIRENPEATQRELAEILGISAPTVNGRVNAIPGFEWENRVSFVTTVLGSADSETIEEAESSESLSKDAVSRATTETGTEDSPMDPAEQPTDDAYDNTGDEIGTNTVASPETPGSLESGTVGASLDIESAQIERLIRCINDLQAQLDRSNRAIDADQTPEHPNSSKQKHPFDDPELAHKIIRVCMETEKITEDEEIKIIEHLL